MDTQKYTCKPAGELSNLQLQAILLMRAVERHSQNIQRARLSLEIMGLAQVARMDELAELNRRIEEQEKEKHIRAIARSSATEFRHALQAEKESNHESSSNRI